MHIYTLCPSLLQSFRKLCWAVSEELRWLTFLRSIFHFGQILSSKRAQLWEKNWIKISCKYAHLHIMSFITTKFHKILLSSFRGVALTRKTGLMDWLTDGRVKNIISSATRCVGYKNTAWKIFQVDDEFHSPVYGSLQHFQ